MEEQKIKPNKLALGTGVGIWGWLATAAGGAFISSLIQNYEKKEKNED